ncbi:J domain-containing protein [Mycena kentingensis (nom. inval.)]|nr:J domain-containing protein [Mycena kentingensis (nom. inval.)]
MASSSTAPDDIEKLLARETNSLQRDVEVERILKAFKLNPYDIIDIDESCTPEEIKKRYKQLSLFIHPDKCPHPRAPEAFDMLKKAEQELSDEIKRGDLDEIIKEARLVVLKNNNLPATTAITSVEVRRLNPSFKVQLRAQTKDLLIQEELRRRKAIKMNLANEGHEARQKEVEVETKKRKAEDDKAWEERREERVDNWRSFASGKSKKKKTKGPQLLG